MAKPQTFPTAEEIHLPNAPLAHVLAQVRFEMILAIQNQAAVAPFQEAIREDYPIVRTERTRAVVNGPDGNSITVDHAPIWKFSDLSGAWRVSLAPDFVALETSAYKSRAEFLAKFESILLALLRTLKPGVVTRVGIRYIDRITGDALASIRSMVRPELVGVLTPEINVAATASEALFKVNGDDLFARWGLLPSNATVDPRVLEAIDRESWILDIDSSCATRSSWDHDALSGKLRILAAHCYNFFRWSVTDEFLKYYGGKKG